MRVLHVFLWLLLFTGSSASADPFSIVTYNSRADWQAAATGRVTTLGFEVDNWNHPFLLLSTGTGYLLSGTPQQPEFFGVRSSVPIEWVRITHASAVLNIDNVETDTVIPTPEPASILLFGTGLTALLRSRRKPARTEQAG